ncbi:glucokinase [Methylobacterium sp. PvR107]|uniref:glucokinase n=1 Tax=Methylobacterium sp. PvR107 TaxID=2806597 RepID=UPI001AE4A97C|nr:glucokinase [Methylobacterium sp. PvR107]MBP1179886.1 glucokinase [Methylobacterium sp. PvR107]
MRPVPVLAHIGGTSAPFGDAFEDKPPSREAMRAIPRFVITGPEPAIHGLAVLLSAGDRFLFPGQDRRS